MGMELLKVFMSAFWDKHWLIYFCISKKLKLLPMSQIFSCRIMEFLVLCVLQSAWKVECQVPYTRVEMADTCIRKKGKGLTDTVE